MSDVDLSPGERADLVREHDLPVKKTTAAPTLGDGETPSSAEAGSEQLAERAAG